MLCPQALLVGAGLQNKELMDVGETLALPPQSTLGNFNRAMTRAYRALAAVQEAAFASTLVSVVPDLLAPIDITVDQDLNRLAKVSDETLAGVPVSSDCLIHVHNIKVVLFCAGNI